jgi:hypothetical protein
LSKLDSQLLGYVNGAVGVQQKRPDLFDFTDVRGEASGSSISRGTKRRSWRDQRQGGVCAADNEEVALKVSNDFNEQFNIWTSAGYTRRSYITTCFPAQF